MCVRTFHPQRRKRGQELLDAGTGRSNKEEDEEKVWFFATILLLSNLQTGVWCSPDPAVLSPHVCSMYRGWGYKIKWASSLSSRSTGLFSVMPKLSTSCGAAMLELVFCHFLSPKTSHFDSWMWSQEDSIHRTPWTGERFKQNLESNFGGW